MNARINQLVKSLLQKDTLEQCSLREVEQFAERYPYFGAAQLLLTKKLQAENSDRYAAQLQKTYLFFHNPLWVEQLLNETGNGTIVQEQLTELTVPPVAFTNTPSVTPPIQEVAAPAAIPVEEIPVNTAPEVINTPEEVDNVADLSSPVEAVLTPELMIQEVAAPAAIRVEKIHEEEIPEVTAPEVMNTPEEVDTVADLSSPLEAVLTPEDMPEAVALPVENTTMELSSSPAQEERVPEAETPAPLPEMALVAPEPEKAKEPELPVFNPGMPDAVTGDELLFEPYHTVDYFASQGIKMQEEEAPRDKFSLQLKSFTGWLRTLKKHPAVELGRAPVSTGEHNAELLARDSLQEGDVVTEAMAEVWEKQGHKGKAIDIYRKLSLLEPDKSAYFAAKIDELKKLN
ncbi:MAG: hypothetical protein NTW29_13475 [Bacteroidetes bacterium]|nr:hypothetical protein [Bacteroidota bacterium]